ncbi:hypothetical protein Nepgr_002554 [Nepenthes gracilis]|uniref:Uncharacterized protein n=1 Tax=Nepenthes gracilis TaxID=150966 RepID=A0AAD3P820_NEPGR|nr:hypothetical protein Nepgr_002554 [Nepenthes gracilis]
MFRLFYGLVENHSPLARRLVSRVSKFTGAIKQIDCRGVPAVPISVGLPGTGHVQVGDLVAPRFAGSLGVSSGDQVGIVDGGSSEGISLPQIGGSPAGLGKGPFHPLPLSSSAVPPPVEGKRVMIDDGAEVGLPVVGLDRTSSPTTPPSVLSSVPCLVLRVLSGLVMAYPSPSVAGPYRCF